MTLPTGAPGQAPGRRSEQGIHAAVGKPENRVRVRSRAPHLVLCWEDLNVKVVLESAGTEPLFKATGASSGQTIWVDVRQGEGVERQGPRPMELLQMGLGACLADNVVEILRKKRVAFTGVRLEIEADRAPESPKRFTAIRLHCVVASAGLTQDALDKIMALSAKYCSAHATLEQGVPVHTTAAVAPPAGA